MNLATVFAYDLAIVERFPTIRAGIVHATGLTNGPSPPELLDEYLAEQRSVFERLEGTPIADLPQISAWRRVFAGFGARPTRHRNAAESLLRRLTKRGDLPTINTLVDIGNLVSIRHTMPVAAFDLADVSGPITVSFASGTEPFYELGASTATHPDPGEVAFVDDSGVVCARRWCWRQSAGSATGPATSEALFVVEGHHETASQDARSAAADLGSLLASYQPGGRLTTYLLSPENLGTGTN